MEKPLMYRKRYIPDEIKSLNDDEILFINDEVIVTVIATGFEQPSEPLYHNFAGNNSKELYKDSIVDDIDSDFDVPPFLRDRDNY